MKKSREYSTFNRAMDSILHADPKAVRDAMDAEKRENAAKRKAKKTPSAPGPGASAKGD
jgi:hypothetical protein